MNIGGSVKDRIGRRMVLEGEKAGVLHPGSVIVEATSGNTGIGLAMACAVKGYECIITLPEKMSSEKANVLMGLGAHIIRTPTEAAFDAPESHISIAKRLAAEGKAVLLNQYTHYGNPLAHYDTLAEEIIWQCGGRADAVVIGVGTGGTITGVARKLAEKMPGTLLVGADPLGSILAVPDSLNVPAPPNKVEGIGYDFIPEVLDRSTVHHWHKTDDPESFRLARRLLAKEGMLVGGSSGAVMQAAIAFVRAQGWAKEPGRRVVCVFADSIRNYLTKFLSKEWCIENGFIPYSELCPPTHPWHGRPLSLLKLPECPLYDTLTVAQASELFRNGASILPLRHGETVAAVLLPKKFLELVLLKKLSPHDDAAKCKTKDFVLVPNSLDVAQLSKLLERNDVVLIEERTEANQLQKLWLAQPKDVLHLL